MKRRNAECGKMRRPVKRNKITEGIYGSTLLYLKFVFLWAMVIFADFILEFRFEFLWPFWMLLRSVYDSFKYQGLAFSVFFVCIALTSDLICFFFIPVQWVFFAASTYVWVQYVWYTDKGVCLPTVILCSVFVYVEAGVRLRDLRYIPAHLDLCRPFAAHCIGYPVVTLGFGFKSYVGYRMRQRRQKEVARENSFYMQLLQQALPLHLQNLQPAIKETEKSSTIEKTEVQPLEKQMNGNAVHLNNSRGGGHSKKSEAKNSQQSEKTIQSLHHNHTLHNQSNHIAPGPPAPSQKDAAADTSPGEAGSTGRTLTAHNHLSPGISHRDKEREAGGKAYAQMSQGSTLNKHAHSNGVAGHASNEKSATTTVQNSLSSPDKEKFLWEDGANNSERETDGKASSQPSQPVDLSPTDVEVTLEKNVKVSTKSNSKWEKKENTLTIQREERRKNKNKDKEANKEKDSSESHQKHTEQREKDKDKEREREKEAERGSGERERALRSAVAAERQARAELTHMRQQNEQLTSKLNLVTTGRQADRAALVSAERRLAEERRARQAADARHHRLQKSGECVWEWCRARRAALEQEAAGLRTELQQSQELAQGLQQSLHTAEQQVNTLETRSRENGPEAWRTALTTLRERSQHLERSLSAETRIKLDLFSAVGEAKRQLGLREGVIRAQEKEIDELKSKIAQMLAIMPSDSFGAGPPGGVSKLRLAEAGLACYPPHLAHLGLGGGLAHSLGSQSGHSHSGHNSMSNLDPNATAYTPKGSMVPCGSASEA